MSFDKTTREVVLSRDSYKCRVCGSIEKLEAHHIVPSSRGGPDTENNGITLCKWCHDKTELHTIITRRRCPLISEGRCDYWMTCCDVNTRHKLAHCDVSDLNDYHPDERSKLLGELICFDKFWYCHVFLLTTRDDADDVRKKLDATIRTEVPK